MNKKKLMAPLCVLASFLLVGCSTDEVVARPSWVDDSIIDNPTEGDKYKDNTLKEIYDAIKKLSDTNSSLLNKVIYDIAKNEVGTFNELATFRKEEAKSTIEFKQFVDSHKLYQPDAKSAVIENNKSVIKDLSELTDEDKKEISRAKIDLQYTSILERVFEKLFNEINGTTYTVDSTFKLFSEEEYAKHLVKELYNVVVPDGFNFDGKRVITPRPTNYDSTTPWKDYVNCETTGNGYLHILLNNGEFTTLYKDYIERKILPDIYRNLLIETYVREQRYTNLGRSYARKVKMISIPHGEYAANIQSMIIYYVKSHITGSGANAAPVAASLDHLNSAMIGIADISSAVTPFTARDYLEKSGLTTVKIPNTNTPIVWQMHVDPVTGEAIDNGQLTYVYKGTKLGDLVEKYLKIYDVDEITSTGVNFKVYPKYPMDEDATSAYKDFTSTGTYPIKVGLEIKEREILSTDLTQDGWYLKDGGLTDLNEDFRKNLFNIATSNIIDDTDKTYENGDFVRYFDIEGNKTAYLVGSAVEEKRVWDSVVLNDGSNFYLVEVNEAASSAKLSISEETKPYIKLKATSKVTDSNAKMNEIVYNITKQVASSDTYKKNAEQYYLMISDILFYDQSAYDYFKEQFPDLFK